MQNNKIAVLLKGMCIGGTMLVPGVSGGSMAIILGIYDKLVLSVSSFMKHKLESLAFLLVFSLGGILGMVLFANPLLQLINLAPLPMLYFFIGAVAGSIPLIVKTAQVKKFSWHVPFYIGTGLLIVLLLTRLSTLSTHLNLETGLMSFLSMIVAGFISAIALVLPGISVSYMLLILGLYNETMQAISHFYLPFLIPLGIGLVLGIVLTTRFLEIVMTKYPTPTYLMILGFMLGSMVEIFPGFPVGWELPVCTITLLSGFGVIQFLSLNQADS